MDRRSFLRGSAIAVTGVPAVAAPAVAAVLKPGGRRISIVRGDPGERLYSEACGDGKRVTVFLDGVEQKWCETADESDGFVDRIVETPGGNMAFNWAAGEVLKERVYGDVRIVIG